MAIPDYQTVMLPLLRGVLTDPVPWKHTWPLKHLLCRPTALPSRSVPRSPPWERRPLA
jgi:hypothetical protein